MTCPDFVELLPLHLYGDLNDGERVAVDAHLADCATCRAELAALDRVRAGLNAVAVSSRVDPVAMVLAESERQKRGARRWQIAAALAAVAAVLAVVLNVEVRVGQGQMLVRWGTPPPTPDAPPASSAPVAMDDSETRERLATMGELIHALAANVEGMDRQQREELARLRREVSDLRRVNQRRLAETERDVSALYAAQFRSRPRGENP